MTACPCGRGEYVSCCEPLHLGQQTAQSAEQLMRSRYSAFAKQKIDYLIQTTALRQQYLLDVAAIRDWSVQNTWLQLEIVRVEPKLGKKHAAVEFKAHFQTPDGQRHVHHEASIFVQQHGKWYFLDPTVTLPSLKQSCICGSDKKYKQCCAPFLQE